MSPLHIKNQVIMPSESDKVRDLGFIIDSKLTMESHTANVVRCFYTNFANYGASGVRWPLMLDVHTRYCLCD